jgi:hypothetical protein
MLGHRSYIHQGGELGGFTPHRHGKLLLDRLVAANINFGFWSCGSFSDHGLDLLGPSATKAQFHYGAELCDSRFGRFADKKPLQVKDLGRLEVEKGIRRGFTLLLEDTAEKCIENRVGECIITPSIGKQDGQRPLAEEQIGEATDAVRAIQPPYDHTIRDL